jgi:hypothetical protein
VSVVEESRDCLITETELLKLQKNGQFPDDLEKTKVSQIHYVVSQTYCQ